HPARVPRLGGRAGGHHGPRRPGGHRARRDRGARPGSRPGAAGDVSLPGRPVTVLISSAGRRVELLRGFRRALAALGLDGRIIATAAAWDYSVVHEAVEGFLVRRLDDPAYVPALLELCEKQAVDLVVPTIDTEMPAWVASRHEFEALGVTIALSDAAVV